MGIETHQLTVRCPACEMVEAFDLGRLACGQRDLPPAAIAGKLRCRCGSRQRLFVEHSREPAPRHDPPWARLWYD